MQRDVYVTNVKDFGAKGDGSTDDMAAIQAAIDSTSGANRGIIFFPLGSYIVSAPLTFNYNGNLSIAFIGVAGTSIVGNFNDYVFKRALVSPNNTTGGRIFEKLDIQNSGATGGCIQLGSTDGAYIRDCTFNGHICVTTEDSAGNSSQNVVFENCIFVTQGTVAGSHGVIIGGSGALMACDCHNADTAFRVYGKGFSTSGNRTENCNTGFLMGVDSAGTDRGASGFSLGPGTFEGNLTSIDLVGTCSGFMIASYGCQGHGSSNAGYPSGVSGSQYGLRVRAGKASAGVIAFGPGSYFDVAGIAIENASSPANLVFIGCQPNQAGGAGVPWILPTNAYTAQFINCNALPKWTFSQLPTGGNVLEGDEFNVSDISGTWGTTHTGGGATSGRVRYNGTNYTVLAV